jgi:hypothetical protein
VSQLERLLHVLGAHLLAHGSITVSRAAIQSYSEVFHQTSGGLAVDVHRTANDDMVVSLVASGPSGVLQ